MPPWAPGRYPARGRREDHPIGDVAATAGSGETPPRIPWRLIDQLLEDLPRLRQLAAQWMPRSTDIVRFEPGRSGGSPIEAAALRRAALTAVLDVVDAVLRALPGDLRRLAYRRYRERWWRAKLRAEFHISEATLKRRLNLIRWRVWEALQMVPPATLTAFWRYVAPGRPWARRAPAAEGAPLAGVVAMAQDPEGREVRLVRARPDAERGTSGG